MKRLLYIAHRVPYPPDKGERVRAFNEIKALSSHFRITLAALARGKEDCRAADALRQWCERVVVAPAGGWLGLIRGAFCLLGGGSVTEGYFRSRWLRRLIAAEAGREPLDLVFCYSSSTLPYGLVIPAKGRIMDLVDVDSAKWLGYASDATWPKSWLYHREAAGVGVLERRAVEQFDAVLLVSEAEAVALPFPTERVLAIGNGVDTDFFRPGAVEPVDLGPASLVFTGQMDYRPNVQGVRWFVRDVWPQLRRDFPDLTFTIVGRNPAPAVRRLAQAPGVTVTGTVPDARPYLAAAAVAVCPLQIARGIQNKVLEAMAMGRAVVASPPSLAGLDVNVGEHVLQADAADQWQAQIATLLADVELRCKLGRAAREHVLRNYNWETRMEPLVALCQGLCGAAARQPTAGLVQARGGNGDDAVPLAGAPKGAAG